MLFIGFFYLLLKSLDQLRKKTKNFAQIFSHTGFSLLLISILLNSFSSKELFDIIQKKGMSVNKSKNLYEAIEIASQNKLNVCICGSLYLAGEFLKNNQTIPN